MRYKVFWFAAIPLLSVAIYFEWKRGLHMLVPAALGASVVISYIWGWIWEWRENAKAREQERLTLRCKHGNLRFKSCTPCAEEFAYWETCKLCGSSWDTRREKHEHTLHVENVSGCPTRVPVVMSHYSSQMSMSMMVPMITQTYLTSYYPTYPTSSPMSSLQHGAECRLTR